MTPQQALAFGIIGVAVAFFASNRFRYDVIALLALLVGVLTGLVPAKEAFSGFTSDVVVIIASALVISAAIARSGLVESFLAPLLSRLKTPATQVPVLAGVTALLSMPTKNVGALAILMPPALALAKRTGTAPSQLLMPMSFLSLLGGLVTLVGTSTNIIVSQVREETEGAPFQMFDFAPVGLALTALGLLFIVVGGWRLLPKDRKGRSDMGAAVAGAPYSTEALVPTRLPDDIRTIDDLKLSEDNVSAVALIAANGRRGLLLPDIRLRPGDQLILEGEPEALARVFDRTPLRPIREQDHVSKESASEEIRSVETVIQKDSVLVGETAQRVRLQNEYGVKLIAVRRDNERISERLREVTLREGDVLVLQAGAQTLPDAMKAIGVLPLAERDVRLGSMRRRFSPAIILAVAMVLVAFKLVPVAVAFFGAAVLMAATGALSMREAYDSLEGEVLVLIGALTPLSEAVRHVGGTDLIAGFLAHSLASVPPLMALGVLLVTAMACSPFLHNAPTVLVLAPIAVGMAQRLHLHPDAFLMAVAVGAGCDFLTPIGHQCNTLVMGPGGYKFSDYPRLGLPLSILVIVVAPLLIAAVWGLRPH